MDLEKETARVLLKYALKCVKKLSEAEQCEVWREIGDTRADDGEYLYYTGVGGGDDLDDNE